MQIHQIRPKTKRKRMKRIGRGGKRGAYSGRGIEGQKSRAGRKLAPAIRQLIKKYPKLRGHKFKPKQDKVRIINVLKLEKHFKENEVVSPKSLLEKKLISRIKGRTPEVKILARGDLKKSLVISDCLLSKSAKEKIEKAGGSVK